MVSPARIGIIGRRRCNVSWALAIVSVSLAISRRAGARGGTGAPSDEKYSTWMRSAGIAEAGQRRLAVLDQIAGAAQEGVIDLGGGRDRADQGLDLFGVDAAVEQRELLLLAREHVMHGEALEEAVLQILERLLEDDALRGAVAIDQHEAASRLAREQRAQRATSPA